jgi:hypothetical protein
MMVRRAQLAPHLPAHPKQQDAAGEQQSDDLQQLNRDGSEADAQDRGGQYADQNRFFSLTLGQSGGCKADDDRIVAGEHQIDHHDLEKRCQSF